MAQATGYLSFANVRLQVSANGSTWTNISGFTNAVSVDGGERQSGEDYTADGDTAVITYGKREPIEVTAKILFTQGASDPTETIRTAYENGSALYLQWAPDGGSTGDFVYTTSEGKVTSPIYPQGEAGSPDPVMIEFTLKCASVTKSVAS